jgi:cytoskeleton protein RodZ
MSNTVTETVPDAAGDGASDRRTDGLNDDHAEAAAAAAPPPLSFGAALAAAREAIGVSVGDMAGRMRLHPRQIAALEAEQISVLPEATFVRGFIRNYAKEVRLDPAPLLASFNARVGPGAPVRGIGQGPSRIVQAAERERMSRQLVILGGVGLLILLGAIGWLASQRPATAPTPPPAAPVAPAAAPTPAAAVSDQPAAMPGASAASDGATSSPGSTAAVAPTVEAAAAPRPEPTDAARAAPVAAAGGPTLRVNVGERPSWVEVIQQVDGRVVYSGLVEPNAERRVLVVPPVRVTIGNASVVKLEYRGKPVELAPHVRGEDVARLTLD